LTKLTKKASINSVPNFYFKFRKLNHAYDILKKSKKRGLKKDLIPAVLMEYEKRNLLPIKGGLIKRKGNFGHFNVSHYGLGREYANGIAENLRSPLFKSIKMKNNKLTSRTSKNIFSKISPMCKKVDFSRNRVGSKGI
jgi:curved DNA-binding protein CbpA